MKKSWEEICNQARHLAYNSGVFTDDPAHIGGDTYLVKDMETVVKAFREDLEAGLSYDSPEEFLDAHGIEWE